MAPVAAPEPRRVPPAWSGRWGLAGRIGGALVVIGLLFILAGPFLTPHDLDSVLSALWSELQPLPG